MAEIDLKKVPFADWLEEAIPTLCGLKAKCIGLVAILEDGGVATNYWQADTNDLAAMGYRLTEDAILNTLWQNGRELRDIINAVDDDDGPAGPA